MADETDVLLKMFEEQWAQARQSENQRSTLTNIVLFIASAIIGLISQNGITQEDLPLAILLTVIGLYGAIASQKLYERFAHHARRPRFWRQRIDELNPEAHFLKLYKEADEVHNKKFPVLRRVRLHLIWFALHLLIAVSGLALTILIIVSK